MGGGEVPPGVCSCLPYLRLDIDTYTGINPTADHKDVSVCQRSVRRVPTAIIHVRPPRPGTVRRVIGIGVRQAEPVSYVSTGHEELSISEKGMAGTEKVCSHVDLCRVYACGGVPQNRIIPISERRPPQNFARGKNMRVHRQEWPHYRGRPLSDRRSLRLRHGNWEDACYDQREERNETRNRSLKGERLPMSARKWAANS